jgi:hypothetical protein
MCAAGTALRHEEERPSVPEVLPPLPRRRRETQKEVRVPAGRYRLRQSLSVLHRHLRKRLVPIRPLPWRRYPLCIQHRLLHWNLYMLVRH